MNSKLFAAAAVMIVCLTVRADDASDWKRLNHEGTRALEKNDFATAEKLLLEAASKAEVFGPKDKRYAESYRPLVQATIALRDYSRADFACTRLAYADGMVYGTNDLRVARDLLAYVEVCGYTGEFNLGREALDRATAIVTEKRGNHSAAMGLCFESRAHLELQQKQYAVADGDFQKALELLDGSQTRIDFSDADMQMHNSYFQPPRTYLANVLNAYAICQRQEKKYPESEASLKRAIDIIEEEYGKRSLNLFSPLGNLSGTYFQEGKLPEAEAAARRALSLVDRNQQGPAVQSTRNLLAKILKAEGK